MMAIPSILKNLTPASIMLSRRHPLQAQQGLQADVVADVPQMQNAPVRGFGTVGLACAGTSLLIAGIASSSVVAQGVAESAPEIALAVTALVVVGVVVAQSYGVDVVSLSRRVVPYVVTAGMIAAPLMMEQCKDGMCPLQ